MYEYEGGHHGVPPSFGELALLHNQARSASVKALTAGSLWYLDRRSFKTLVQKSDSRLLVKALRAVDILAALRVSQLQRLADTLVEVQYSARAPPRPSAARHALSPPLRQPLCAGEAASVRSLSTLTAVLE